jgi:OOP family OmpA-OmpF porin
MKKVNLTKLFFLTFLKFIAQSDNLVSNGSFEDYNKCPNDISQISRAKHWRTPSKGTSDYFNSCSINKNASVPDNSAGHSYAHGGNGYGHFGVFARQNNVRYEFIQTKLIESLKSGQSYCLTFFVKNATVSTLKYSGISCLLSSKEININDWQFYNEEDLSNNIYIDNKVSIKNKYEWQKVCVNILPKGGERYLTIGFTKVADLNNLSKNNEVSSSYYIDDISLIKVSDCICGQEVILKDTIQTIIPNTNHHAKVYILKNVNFKTKSSTLETNSFDELNSIVKILKSDESLKVSVEGHTDNVGIESRNQILSEERAKSVADYLVSQGISKERVTFIGFGDSKPIADNSSDFGRSKNRRVEILFY